MVLGVLQEPEPVQQKKAVPQDNVCSAVWSLFFWITEKDGGLSFGEEKA